MQFLESSIVGLRAARHQMTSPTYAPKVTLYPMVHVGEAAFYDQVYAEALDHDLVLYEGVGSKVVANLTRSYRWLDPERVGLVVQPKLPEGSGRARRILADLSSDEFDALWRDVPMYLRAAMAVTAPLAGLCRRLVLTRAGLARGLNENDLSSREDTLMWSARTDAILKAIRTARDARLCETLRNALFTEPVAPRTVAVLYGAAHMAAAARFLNESGGYRPDQSRWMTVIGT